MKVFFRFFRDYPRESILAPLFKLLEACFDLLVPIVVAQIIDGGIRGGQGDGFIRRRAGVLVLLAVVGLTCTIIAQYFFSQSGGGHRDQPAARSVCAYAGVHLCPDGSRRNRCHDHAHDQRHQPDPVRYQHDAAADTAFAYHRVRCHDHGVHH